MLAALIYCLLLCPGTDATHAEHIETIKARLYVGVRPDGKFVPGELGMGLVEGQYPVVPGELGMGLVEGQYLVCLLYTSDAADE